MRPLKLLLFLLVIFISTRVAAQGDTASVLDLMGGSPCPNSDFTCVALTVPLNHFAADRGLTIEVVFGVLPATGERKGMFVTVTGGPGYSGLDAADSYTAAFDPSIPEHFDIVFFDQRGIAASGNLQCVNAAVTYYQSDFLTLTPEQEAATINSARTFAEDCVEETGISPELLAFYGTNQAVEDLEIFRQAIGDDQFWLYGESYGTQFAQTYAAAHPEHLAGLILDGTVDLTLTIEGFLEQQAQAFNDSLVATLEACNADEGCAADVDGDAVAVYDDLAAELAESPATFTFPLPSGGTAERTYTLSDLETAAAGYVYSEASRLLLQRALAGAAHGDLAPLARLTYGELFVDPETLEPLSDPTYSDAVYYAVECNDYDYFAGTSDERAEAYIRAGDEVEANTPRLASIFYGDLPCAFWPGVPQTERPSPLVAEGIPTLVLGATADPATPVGNGESVYSHLAEGYLMTTEGGAHVIFGRDNECPDAIVTAFLVDGTLPEQREIICEGVVSDPYVPLPPADAADFADPLEAMVSVDTEIYYLPEYFYWDLETPTSVGCPYGGVLTFEPSDEGEHHTLTDCAFSGGFAMTGTGTYDYENGTFTLDVDVAGLADGHLTFIRMDEDGSVSVVGDYDGEAIDLSA
jgi:pimeloyl-ACP methyl ester carboxylesterase